MIRCVPLSMGRFLRQKLSGLRKGGAPPCHVIGVTETQRGGGIQCRGRSIERGGDNDGRFRIIRRGYVVLRSK